MPIIGFDRTHRLYLILAGLFVTNVIVAEFIGVKIFALEPTLGLADWGWSLFGQEGSLQFTAGVLLWPVVFIMTDILNEYFGVRGVRFISFLTVGLIIYAFVAIIIAIQLAPADWWDGSQQEQGIPSYQAAYKAVFGQSSWIIVASVIAFLIGQLIDAFAFRYIRRLTGEQKVWLRANGSTLVSQLIDSFIVLYIAFVIGPAKWSVSLWLAIGTVNFIYKLFMAVLLTPLIYLAHALIDRYLGQALSEKLRMAARS